MYPENNNPNNEQSAPVDGSGQIPQSNPQQPQQPNPNVNPNNPLPQNQIPVNGNTTNNAASVSGPKLEDIKFGVQRDPDKINIKLLILPIIVAAVIVVLLYGFVFHTTKIVTTTTSTSTISTTTTISYMKALDACSVINSSGSYYLSKNINTNISSGSCILIKASNVNFICNQNFINGSGPYINKPPYTTGVYINDVNNVSVQNCQINHFSFGIIENNTKGVAVEYNNISTNYISNLRLENGTYGIIQNNIFAKAVSNSGSVSITNNSTGNHILNNILQYNPSYGFLIDSINNMFLNNSITDTEQSFYCSPLAGLKGNNSALGNICYNSTNCNFLECSLNNNEYNTLGIKLKKIVNTCGTISRPGFYVLSGNINMSASVLVQYTQTPCIYVNASNVMLNCNNYNVTHATIGIEVKNASNVTITNCNVLHSNTGIYLYNASPSNITNANLSRNIIAGLSMYTSDGGLISNITTRFNNYGIYLTNSPSSTINKFKSSNNTYGIYLSNSLDISFANGFAFNNSLIDIYANSNKTTGASSDLMQQSACGTTDALWAVLGGCHQQLSVTPPFKYDENLCAPIKTSGIYLLGSNIVNVGGNCFIIYKNNTILNCNNHIISSTQNNLRNGIIIDAENNVTITNCTISGFNSGIYINQIGAKNITIINDKINDSSVALNISNIYAPIIEKNILGNPSTYGAYINNVIYANITNNLIKYGRGNATAIYLNNSKYNDVSSNKANNTYDGIYLEGASVNNTVYNNSVIAQNFDYICSTQAGGINSQINGIDYGITKQNCLWLAALSKLSPNVPCSTSISPNTYSLLSDYIYPFGGTCYTIESNNTNLNCNGHTIIATNGGTFMAFVRAQNVQLSNCVLIGFTNAIKAMHSSVKITNNTIFGNDSTPLNSVLINVTNSKYVYIDNNKLMGLYNGISESNVSSGSISNNNVTAYMTGILLNHVIGQQVLNNNVPYYGVTAMELINSSGNNFNYNKLYGASGIVCSYGSMNASTNSDLGGNSCSSNTFCSWMVDSSTSCPAYKS